MLIIADFLTLSVIIIIIIFFYLSDIDTYIYRVSEAFRPQEFCCCKLVL